MTWPDPAHIRRAFRLACLGSGRAAPNPLVGAVVVKDGRVVGHGTHVFAHRLHAERLAFAEAGEQTRGADLYVTLEPCSHHGRTPPCAEAVLEAGIRRVHVGMEDPNPLVAGRGLRLLREAGLEVVLAGDPTPYRMLNRAFIRHITTTLPWVVLKAALTLDGRMAPASGRSQWITSARARAAGQLLRFRCDAILVGAGTMRADNPTLTCRHRRKRETPLLRVVLAPELNLPPSCSLLATLSEAPLLVLGGEGAAPEARHRLERAGAEVALLPCREGRLEPEEILGELGRRNITSVLVEGGSGVHTSFLRQGLADEFYFFYAPKLLGTPAVPLAGDLGSPELSECPAGRILETRFLPPDVLIHGLFREPLTP